MTTSTLRSTAAIAEYLTIIDGLAVAGETLKSLQRREKELRHEVLSQIGERRSVMHCDAVRTLRRAEKESYSLECEESQAVAYCELNGIAIDVREPKYLSGAKRSKYGRERILPADILSVSSETVIVTD